MSASFAYEDPYLRAQSQAAMNTTQKASQIFKEMGKGMWTSGKSFGKIGALFAGVECVIESVCQYIILDTAPYLHYVVFAIKYRAKNDIYNSVSAGFVSGGILARNSGPKAVVGGGLAFAAFSAVIDLVFLRRDTPEYVLSFHFAHYLLTNWFFCRED